MSLFASTRGAGARPWAGLRRLLLLVALLVTLGATGRASDSDQEENRARQIVDGDKFKAAVAAFEHDYERYVAELIELTEIPAPSFHESKRAEAFARLLREAGIEQVSIDSVGNVIGVRPGQGRGPVLAVAAHLDTVFPLETDVKVKRTGTRLLAPGIGDDGRGLAFLLAAVRAMREAKIATPGDLLIVADVGEEGIGDLRGVRHLLKEGEWKGRIQRFISVDGQNNDMITNGALGSRRYRATFKGPGGHSWGAFGQVNPAFPMGNAIVNLGKLVVPRHPKVSYNVGIVGGGTSVNSIPFEVSMDVDLRSASPEALQDLDDKFKEIVEEAVKEENRTRMTTFGRITCELKLIGDRPSGIHNIDTPMLRQVAATMQLYDKVPVWDTNSTDANMPISMGIPAFAMAAQSSLRGGRSHSLEEWTDVEKTQGVRDFSLALAILLSVAEVP